MLGESQPNTPHCLGKRPKVARSSVSNGSRLLMADGRSPWSRRFRDIVALHCQDLGGYENLSQAELAIIRRAATLQVELEAQEAKAANGEAKIDLVAFAQVANGLRRLLETIGIKRTPRDVTPTLASIIAEHKGRGPPL